MGSIFSSGYPHIGFEEYLFKAERSEEKLEYFQGLVYAMAGGSQFHSAITMNIAFALMSRLKNTSCRVMSSDQMIETPSQEAAYYPDLSVVCQDKLLPRLKSITTPTAVIEVLSPSTRSYDLETKLKQYRRIPSLRHIVFADSQSVEVILYSRGENEVWPGEPERFTQLAENLLLPALNIEIPVQEVYSGLDMDAVN